MKFRKKPIVIEAAQWFPKPECADLGVVEVPRHVIDRMGFTTDDGFEKYKQEHGWIETLEGGHIVSPGDFIITGVQGERYPCKPDIFEATYEPIREAP